MKFLGPEQMGKLMSEVLSIILAPDEFADGGDYPDFVLSRDHEGYDLRVQLRWKFARDLIADPRDFANGFAKFLGPISERITAGTVAEQRREIKLLREQITQLEQQAAELKRYKDAIALTQGRGLS